ncbi:acetoacetate decarboxylase family protein [Streptomyces sudanensis]|uniref:acetoacetate decarboxylase family protein n=1 Tax=Streptomyces sudanensis TaxID=436397 RepID=UPI0020CF1C99|nr:acetoacetate decarboxylase family protein [Streptomyces sudanensis]MCP9989114.1 acetoacetate decarboxylase family protein [Streptomyces sudanensis]
MTESHPPPPWHLRGTMHAALWPVPERRLPRWPLPAGVDALRIGRRCAVVTFWVDYRPGGTLAYRELLVALAVRRGRSLGGCAVEAWVDDPRSLAGGRALWGIPKRPATFAFTRPAPGLLDTAMRTDASPAHSHPAPRVSALHRPLLRLPGRLPLQARLFQPAPDGRGQPVEVPLRVSGTPWLTRTRLRTAPAAPLGYLAGLRPLAACSLRDFDFAIAPARSVRQG